MKSRVYQILRSQTIFNPQRQAHALAGSHRVVSNIVNSDNDETKSFSDAHQVFDEMSEWGVVSATATISRLARHQRYEETIPLFSRMLVMNIRPNEFTFGTVIHSAIARKDLHSGKQLHACALKMGLNSNVFAGCAILDLYAKLSTLEEAQRAFEDTHEPNVVSYTALVCGYLKKEWFNEALGLFKVMPERNVVSWNVMIGGFSQMGRNEEAVNLFIQMLRDGLLPNQSTFPCAISATANIAALGIGKSFHACAIKFLGKYGVFVGNSLVSFYAKCGSMEDSLWVFDRLPERNVVSWNALICGYAQNGRGKEALDFFRKMECAGIHPNSVTLLGVLLACNHVGLVDEGYLYFNQARLKEPSMLKPEHYACMVDLLSRSGHFEEAERFICELPFDPGIGFWKALLGGCQIHLNMEMGEFAARKIMALDPGDVSSYVMLSNAHSAARRWHSVSMIRHEMRVKGMKRVPGCSWIEIKNHVHVFVTADRRQSNRDEIYMVLRFFLEHVAEIQSSELLKEPYIQFYDDNFF
ncbi:pentatricopeptide repeat (PPR) superfamily protein [Actinidia rufa]|uniref:Pentatricopeptide repeat (PPR) superfamily protein n=1 Tax=Actinidia rufa TaxID=165716 RepID=A0A7J0GJQ9_9ERIC|nr:pentatricopeptide repeat (PPR) superfamily protein [Actinidia rufa]